MGSQATSPNQIITLPKGGGAQHGLGEKFSPDLHTGTGNFTVPIALPSGRNGFQPHLNLVYSTGNGNGFFGLGWGLSIPGVTRKSSKGIPRYQDYDQDLKQRDTFILSGAEDLVPISNSSLVPSKVTRYRPRTEGLFAKIIHHHDAQVGTNYWEVYSKDGLISYYRSNPAEPPTDDAGTYAVAFRRRSTAAMIAKPKPKVTDSDRIFAWKLTLTKDPFGNRIEYLYEDRDQGSQQDEKEGHQWDQPLLTQVRYADYQEAGRTKFLVTVSFEYESRDDPFSDYRAGFEIRTTKRCKAILVETHADQDYKVRRYEFTYRSDSLNKVSLLRAIDVVGFDDQQPQAESRELPLLEFGYSDFYPQDQKRRDFYPIQGPDLPATSLANTSVELVDLFGNGLPDVLEMNGSVRYWRNRGNGRFDWPKPMAEAPAGLTLSSAGVQLIDANGDSRTDLMVTDGALSGYYPLQFGGRWDRRSFQKYAYAPSFDLKDPEVRLIDLTGDGITDVIRSGARLECFLNDQHEGWKPGNSCWVERQGLDVFPNVNFSDPRVKLADMTGDGMQDIVLVYDGNVDYYPNLGYGNWGKRLHMRNSPGLPYGDDPKRILLGDVDGDGLSDLIYVDDRHVTLWINQNGNGWSDPIEIPGTPPVSDMDATRLVDLLGSGISGVLWTRDATSSRQDHYLFLDLTGGTKPYVLHEMNNNMGAVTKVKYEPSTKFYLEDEKKLETRWRTPLPFPVQVVARVEVIDDLSKGKLTTEYKYHHGYWDGAEREFRGFGMVEQFDTEIFETYNKAGLHGTDAEFIGVSDRQRFSPPTITKTWFHQGPIGEETGDWGEQDWSNEYWDGDPQLLKHTEVVNDVLKILDLTYSTQTTQVLRRIKRDALRTLRGSILRTELYALDGSPLQDRPHTVTEQAYSLTKIEPPSANEQDRLHIFFPHPTGQRTTQWERGDDPMTQFSLTGEYDDFGQPLSQTAVAMPRRSRKRHRLNPTQVADETRVLITHSRTTYAAPPAGTYIYDRVAHGTSIELSQPQTITETDPANVQTVLQDQRDVAQGIHAKFQKDLENWRPETSLPTKYRVFGHTVNRYDGNAYTGLAVGRVGTKGALTRGETLVFTDEILTDAYKTTPLIDQSGRLVLPTGAPAGFDTNLGYRVTSNEAGYIDGYYLKAQQRQYDSRGLVTAQRDPLDHETTVSYDIYGVLPEAVTDPIKLETKAAYNYRVMQPEAVTDPNKNITEFRFSPIGLLTEIWVKGKSYGNEGDQNRASTQLSYDFLAYGNSVLVDSTDPQPIGVRTVRYVSHDPAQSETIETRECFDGFGRLLQTRAQGEEIRFGNRTFGSGEEVLPAKQSDGRGGAFTGRRSSDPTRQPYVTVSGWQRYDNKGRVVEKYEPFFDVGWEFDPPDDSQLGAKVAMFYDPRGQVIRTVNPDGSEQRVIYGIPTSLADPPLAPTDTNKFSSTPWEAYTYDPNDLAPVSHDPRPAPVGGLQLLTSKAPRHHHFTPYSILIDALGRTLMVIQRNRDAPTSTSAPLSPIEELRTRSTYDIQGNLLTITDPLNREAFVHAYDLTKRVLRVESIDAGIRRMVLNAVGNEMQRRDSKGALSLKRYDDLNRPIELWARDRTGQAITMRERLEYGDESNPNQISQRRTAERNKNRLGKLAEHRDEAGLLQFKQYDFKSNLLDKTRRVVNDAALAVGWTADWSVANADNDLDPAQYTTSTQYDALNRPTQIQYPTDVNGRRAILKPTYNRAGALESVFLDGDTYVQRIAYNAKGQRAFIAYGNDILTRYAYDPGTFRLIRLRTESFTRTGLTYQPTGTLLQDWAYDYDLSGNILAVHDVVPGCGLPNNPDQLDRLFWYDAIYRLISATGRECNQPVPEPYWSDLARCQVVASTRSYTQSYAYDVLGNMTTVAHTAPNNGNFTRSFAIVGGSNRLDTVTVGTRVYDYQYDANGNMIRETSSRQFIWNHTDRLQEFQEASGVDPSIQARYLYDSTGMRIKKWVRRGGTAVNDESVVYVDTMYEHHRWQKNGGGQNNHLHVMDSQNRVAIARKGPNHPDNTGPAIQYHLGDHLGSSNVVMGGATSSDGVLVNREEFFPYGESSFGWFAMKRYRFTGKERDLESGLCYHSARYLSPWLARWCSADPAMFIDGWNLFAYAILNPMHVVDLTGMAGEKKDFEAHAKELNNIQIEFNKTVRETLPTEKTPTTAREKSKDVDIVGEEHDKAVVKIVNAAITAAEARAKASDVEKSEYELLREALFEYVVKYRNQSAETSQNLTLRDADHYLVGRIQEWRRKLPWSSEPPGPTKSPQRIFEGEIAAEKYDADKREAFALNPNPNEPNAKSSVDSNDKPSSAPGGRFWAWMGGQHLLNRDKPDQPGMAADLKITIEDVRVGRQQYKAHLQKKAHVEALKQQIYGF